MIVFGAAYGGGADPPAWVAFTIGGIFIAYGVYSVHRTLRDDNQLGNAFGAFLFGGFLVFYGVHLSR